jgi:hypothetical protein
MAAGCPRYREMQGCRVLMNNPEAASVGGLVIFRKAPRLRISGERLFACDE